MTTSVADERIGKVHTTDDELVVSLVDGRTLSVPLAWYPRLLDASAEQRSDWRLIGGGEGVHWPQIDEDLSAGGLLRAVPAPGARLQAPPSEGSLGVQNAMRGGLIQGEVPQIFGGDVWAMAANPGAAAALNPVVYHNMEALQQLSRESANIYTEFLDSALSLYQQTLQQGAEVAEGNLQTAGQVLQQAAEVANQALQSNVQAAQQGYDAAIQVAQEAADQATRSATGDR